MLNFDTIITIFSSVYFIKSPFLELPRLARWFSFNFSLVLILDKNVHFRAIRELHVSTLEKLFSNYSEKRNTPKTRFYV